MTSESTLKPFSPGDVFVGATLLNDPDDDHAGRGRIIQYDAGLVEKGVLWIDDSTHLVGGLKIDPNGVLWAFDSNAHLVIRVGSDGCRLPDMGICQALILQRQFRSQRSRLPGRAPGWIGDSTAA